MRKAFAIALGIGGLGWWSAPAYPQAVEEPISLDDFRPDPPARDGMPEVRADCHDSVVFAGTKVERSAYCELQKRRYASARTLAQRALKENSESARALYLLAAVQHRGEGNLPKALSMLRRAERIYTERHGWDLTDLEPVQKAMGHRILYEMLEIHGEMDHHQGRIDAADALTLRLGVDHSASKAWPLMKLGRFAEARQVVVAALESEDPWNRNVARTSLCAIESELRRREQAYEACRDAAEMARQRRSGGAVELTNAGAAAEEIFRFAEAESLYLEASRRSPETSVNPWGRLVHIYLSQGRFAEALTAWRTMLRYRAQRAQTYLNQQDEAEARMAGVALMLAAGRSDLAEPVLRSIVNRPDRQGTSSASAEQNEAGAALVARVARLAVARRLENEAVVAPLGERIALNAQAWKLRWDAWLMGRRAARILAKSERLVATLRPEVPGSLELPSWLDAEVIAVVGPGIAAAALRRAQREETLDPDTVRPVFDAYAAEIAWEGGNYSEAQRLGMRSVDASYRGLQMISGRAAAIAGDAAARQGAYSDALVAFREALDRDPAVFTRMGISIPVQFAASASDPVVSQAVDRLRASPMFAERAWGFRLRVSSTGAQLLDATHNEIVSVLLGPNDGPSDQPVRRLVNAIQHGLASPKLDIAQIDISSLEGGIGIGHPLSDQLDSPAAPTPP